MIRSQAPALYAAARHGPRRRVGPAVAWTSALALLVVTLVSQAARAEDRNLLELSIKAAFLYKFPLYVTWPESAFPSPASPFNLCIAGDDMFAALVERAASGQSIADHPMAVLRLRSASASDHCGLLYVAAGDPQLARQQLVAVDGMPVLTATDAIHEAAAKGIVNFVIVNDRVRFEIDNVTAIRDGLAISSKLLSLALSVRSAP